MGVDSCWIGGLKATSLFDNLFFFSAFNPPYLLLARVETAALRSQ